MGRKWNGTLAEMGGSVWGKLQLKKAPMQKKVKRGKRKLMERSISGIWVGV